jgi:hypothetical protein
MSSVFFFWKKGEDFLSNYLIFLIGFYSAKHHEVVFTDYCAFKSGLTFRSYELCFLHLFLANETISDKLAEAKCRGINRHYLGNNP